MKSRLSPVTILLLAFSAVAAITCENAGQGTRRMVQDTASAERSEPFAVATVDTYRIRARKVTPCPPMPEPPASWVLHSVPGLPGATLRVPPEFKASIDTLPDSSIGSEFLRGAAMVHVMFSPHGKNSPGTVPTGCGTRIAGFETPLHLYQYRQGRALDSVFVAQIDFAFPDTVGLFVAISARWRPTRDSLLAVLTSLHVPARVR